jgi:hypothetical protein
MHRAEKIFSKISIERKSKWNETKCFKAEIVISYNSILRKSSKFELQLKEKFGISANLKKNICFL